MLESPHHALFVTSNAIFRFPPFLSLLECVELMADPFTELIVYLRAAQAFKDRLRMSDRDRALVMAGTCAAALRMNPLADFCRQLVLQHNQGHMLRKYAKFSEAILDPDFGVFLKQVRRKLTPEQAESLIVSLGYECDVKPSDYETKSEYAAAVMGVDSKWVKEHFS